ncbi:MAG: tyrosine-type recombinase/integrase [Ktedonobacteraceae bacterium]
MREQMDQLPVEVQRTLELHTDMHRAFQNVIGQVKASSKRVYTISAMAFHAWLLDHTYTLQTVDRSGMIAYHAYLSSSYKTATAARMWSVARNLLQECQALKQRGDDPTLKVKGFKVDDESPHIALSRDQVREMLAAIDTSKLKGKRDYALVALLIRTGIRRAECAALNIGDFGREQGHIVMTIHHGKGDKRRKIKVPVDLFRVLEAYITATGRAVTSLADPLFIGFDRGQHPTGERISTRTIERTVIACGKLIGIEHLIPHDLRATFNTLAKKGGATLEQRQHTMGHRRPETTQRYDRDKDNLDDSAVDYIKL